MKQVANEVARWLGIFTTGTLVGADDERSLARAAEVLGEARVSELRAWFAETPPERVRDAKCAVVEAAIAVAHADKAVAETERELIGRIIQLAELDEASAEALLAGVADLRSLEDITPRITQPALRELALVIAWQMANADDAIDDAERGAYGELAKRLGVEPERAKALRALF